MVDIKGTTKIAGVMGWPIGHSRSPRLHNFWLSKHGIDGAYVAFPVKPANFTAALKALPLLGLAGVNLTVPHKETALSVVDHLDPVARRIGAVNCVVVGRDGALTGKNTDAYGFIENLRQEAPDWLPTLPAVVLGAGGAARAVVAALVDAGLPEIRVTNRTRGRADELTSFGPSVKVHDWDARAAALADAGLVVNTTTLGMAKEPALDLSLAALPPGAVVNDIVYVPMDTDLLVRARARGNRTVDGLGMLLHQARFAFRDFFGTDPAVTADLRAHVMVG